MSDKKKKTSDLRTLSAIQCLNYKIDRPQLYYYEIHYHKLPMY